jgi:hypothetical protein
LVKTDFLGVYRLSRGFEKNKSGRKDKKRRNKTFWNILKLYNDVNTAH